MLECTFHWVYRAACSGASLSDAAANEALARRISVASIGRIVRVNAFMTAVKHPARHPVLNDFDLDLRDG
jgi:hypothetical protein